MGRWRTVHWGWAFALAGGLVASACTRNVGLRTPIGGDEDEPDGDGDGLDNNCDGQIDGPDCVEPTCDGGPGNEYCSQACEIDDDCGDPATWACQAVRVDIRPGYISYVPACNRR